jgi:DNA invertase Pin-like site-specific DNA recombinase
MEREKISQRTKAGLERARARGKVLGRPKFSDGDREKLRMALDSGESWHAVSQKTRIPYATVKNMPGRWATSQGAVNDWGDEIPPWSRTDPWVLTSQRLAF